MSLDYLFCFVQQEVAACINRSVLNKLLCSLQKMQVFFYKRKAPQEKKVWEPLHKNFSVLTTADKDEIYIVNL